MAEITATIVKELRNKTQAGMMDCKKALSETNGDMEAAVKYLREKGLSAASKRAGREASQGMIDIKVSDNSKTYAMFELNAETDFVAKNDKFKALLNNLLEHVLKAKPKDIVDLENQVCEISEEKRKVSELITDTIAVIGENIIARRFAVYDVSEGNTVIDYVHMNNSIGVLVEFSGDIERSLGKDIAMHIAASSPQFISREDVTAEIVSAEKEIFKQQALNEGKPENIVEKIAEGKLNKFYKETCLMEQDFVKDTEKTVKAIIPEGVSIVRFSRFQLGA
ncbi:translation elongation factor Ts [bacterium]|nr:translation elongation factor Ts [bacterium]